MTQQSADVGGKRTTDASSESGAADVSAYRIANHALAEIVHKGEPFAASIAKAALAALPDGKT